MVHGRADTGTVISLLHRLVRTLAVSVALLAAAPLSAAPARPAPPLPEPAGRVVKVSSEPELRAAVSALASNVTILVAPGVYRLRDALYVKGPLSNVAIRGASASSDDVVLAGPGINDQSVPYGVWVGGAVRGLTIANLTIRDIFYHPIILNAGAQAPLFHNVHLINAGQQFIKSNPTPGGGGVDDGVVEYSVIEYETRSRDDYTNGIDVHTGRNWVIRNNLFRNIRAPQGLAGPAILVWNGSENTIAEGNTFINCQREIAFGLVTRTPNDHTGGIIRNNVVYRDPSVAGDAAIGVFDSPNTLVLHNTLLVSGTYRTPIEYRFPDTTGVVIANNLLDGVILARDGARASVTANNTGAKASLFADPQGGDLHLNGAAAGLIDKVGVLADCPADWDGEARPAGSVTDVGADEYRSAAAPAPESPAAEPVPPQDPGASGADPAPVLPSEAL